MNSIGTKSLLGYIAVLVTSIIAAVMLISASQKIEQRTQSFIHTTLPAINDIEQVAHHVEQVLISAYALYGTTLSPQAFDKDIKKHKQEFNQLFAANGKLEQFKQAEALQKEVNLLLQPLASLHSIMTANSIDWDKARNQLAILDKKKDQLQQQLSVSKKDIEKQAMDSSQVITSDIQYMNKLIIAMVVIATAVTAAAHVFASRTITSPVQYLAEEIKLVANNYDLTRRVRLQQNDEVGTAGRNINLLIDAFKGSLTQANSANQGINKSVQELNHQAKSADQQVFKLNNEINELISSSESLDNSIQQSMQRSQLAAEAAQQGAEQVEQGASQVDETAKSIASLAVNIEQSGQKLDALKSSGDRVSGVVSSIAEIAEQTNLLALNAAIEAARAGDTGRGFAVVADEVRTLANRTQQSTLEIDQMLTEIVTSITDTVTLMEANSQQAEHSVKLAEDTVGSLSQIRHCILELSNSSSEVAGLTQDARQAVGDMKQQVGQFKSLGDAVTDTSSETRNISEGLKGMASELNSSIERFQI